MKKTLVVLIAVFTAFVLMAGAAYAKDLELKKKAGEYEVELTIDKNPPVVGDNNVAVEVEDASGKYVTDAKVTVEYSMPAMPGMPPMNYKTDTKLEGNEYKAKIGLSMSGPWNVSVKVNRGGKTSTAKFTIDAR